MFDSNFSWKSQQLISFSTSKDSIKQGVLLAKIFYSFWNVSKAQQDIFMDKNTELSVRD
jgi:hypothetical protein